MHFPAILHIAFLFHSEFQKIMGFLQSLFTDKFVQNILTIIYQSPFLLSIYKFYKGNQRLKDSAYLHKKGVVRFTTNTSEIYRVCKSVIKEQENLKKTSEETTPLLTRNEISLSPVLLYRIGIFKIMS